jgi:hypothetical protein
MYMTGDISNVVTEAGVMKLEAPDVIYSNYSGKEIKLTFTNPDFAEIPEYVISDPRVKIENGLIYATGDFPSDTVVHVEVHTKNFDAEFDVTVKMYSRDFIEKNCQNYEKSGIIDNAVKGGTVFVGDSYFTEAYWKDFYTDFAGENAYLLGIGGSIVEQWFMCSERLLYPLEPSEVMVHLGFNDIYGSAAHLTAEEIGAQLVALLTMYHEELPDAKIYFCSVESSKWSNTYERSFTTAITSSCIFFFPFFFDMGAPESRLFSIFSSLSRIASFIIFDIPERGMVKAIPLPTR